MPVYEYACSACGRRSSIFFRSISAVEDQPACPHCGQRALSRRLSRVWTRRPSSAEGGLEPTFVHEGVPFYGGDESMLYEGDEGGEYGDFDGGELGDEDVVEFARQAREMSAMMGEPLDEDFDAALRHIAEGADPDDVFGELDQAQEQAGEESPTPDKPG